MMSFPYTDRERANRDTKQRILLALREMQAQTVIIRYTGSGDSGCVDDIEVFGKGQEDREGDATRSMTDEVAQKSIQAETRRSTFDHEKGAWREECRMEECSLKDALEDLCYHLLSLHFPGWEINEGSDGMLELNVDTGELSWEHNENITTQETHMLREVL